MKQLDLRNFIGLLLLLISVFLLIPGLINDMLTLEVAFHVPILGRQNVSSETRSVLGAISSLFENGNPTVGFLILLFSVIVPFAKAIIMATVLLIPSRTTSVRLHKFVSVISKWSMADVFVVGVFIALLSTNSNENVSGKLHSGFYYFAAYCIVSILAVQLIKLRRPEVA